MVFAVAMTFIDQTIVVIAIPRLQRNLPLSFGSSGASACGHSRAITHGVALAFAHSTQTIFHIMAGVMAVTFLVTVRWMPRGRAESVEAVDPHGGGDPRRELGGAEPARSPAE